MESYRGGKEGKLPEGQGGKTARGANNCTGEGHCPFCHLAWTDNARVWFVQTEVQFAVRGVTSSLTKFFYCVEALNHADAAQVVGLIEFPPEENPYESLKECLTELYTLNPFQRHQALMALTLVADKTLMGKICSLLPLDPQDPALQVQGFLPQQLSLEHPNPPDQRGHQGSQETCLRSECECGLRSFSSCSGP